MKYYVYIATNVRDTVLYIGMTNNIQRRMYEHANGLVDSFTNKYNVYKLVWYQEFNTPEEAIIIEKKLKGWKRDKKIKLITNLNPTFKDLL
ncbi:MAG TPA: GIY-YIG nuclease family protein [Candidatus Woesebacteria bacterium]|nr:GIY-YIG nuclease family protein [Candidatus Woesebacteria bacterium]